MGEPSRIDSLETLGKYTLIDKIGDGYLGPVYRSFDQDLDCTVDVRILCDGIKWDAELEDLFQKECEAITRLQHPNIAALIGVSTEGRFHFMTMEPLGARDLKKLIEQKPGMSFETKISIMIQVAEGVGFSHREGILHRNLCPENIFMAGDGFIKIRDFAIAHVLMRHLPHPGVRWGAPIYLSPEQIQHKECNAQSDIFALGVIFYELLTGVHPFYAQDSNKALDNILQNIQIPTFERYPDFHPRIWQILKTCLAKNPDDRYSKVDDMLDAFRGLLKDMAEDVQLMLSELQSSFASLKIAAERPGVSDSTVGLYNKVQNLLRGIDNTDYSRLDQLITQLLEVYPEIRETASEQKIYDSLLQPKAWLDPLQNSQDESSLIKNLASFPSQLKEVEDGVPSSRDPVAPAVEKEASPLERSDEKQVEDVVSGDGAVCDAGTKESRPEDLSSDSNVQADIEEPIPEYGGEGQISNGSLERQELPETGKAHPLGRKLYRRKFKRILKPIYRTVAAILTILLVAIAIRYVQGSGAGDMLRGAFENYVLNPLATVKSSVLKQAQSGDDERASIESAEILNETASSQYETALLDELEEPFTGEEGYTSPPQNSLDRIAVMIGSGKLQQAKAELDRLRRLYPNSPQVTDLYGKWQSKVFKSGEEERREESFEMINPSDSNIIAGLQSEIESRMASPSGMLTVYRLGDKAILLLDGKRIDNEGEIIKKRIPAGSHEIILEKNGNAVASRMQELIEGQATVLVYDLGQRNIRPMIEPDQILIDRRKAMEGVHRFEAEHPHGILGGNCRGELILSFYEVVYVPVSGSHGFRVPFKLLKLIHDGSTINLLFISDNQPFKKFEFEDAQAAARFSQTWNKLKSLPIP